MRFLKEQKYVISHSNNSKFQNELELRRHDSRDNMMKRFEDKKRRHMDAFKPQENKSLILSSTHNDMDYSEIAATWLQEYEHPSSTAAISVEGKLLCTEIKYPANTASVCSSHSKSLVLSVKHDFVVRDSTPSSVSDVSGDFSIFQQSFNIDNHVETRPSFGKDAITSTPLVKLAPGSPSSIENSQEPNLIGNDIRFIDDDSNKITVEDDFLEKEPVHSFTSNGAQKCVQLLQELTPTETMSSQISSSIEPKNSSYKPFTLVSFYGKEIESYSNCETAKLRFEKESDRILRSNIKRTITERVTVYSKRMATKQEIYNTVAYFTDLFSGIRLNGFNDQNVQLCDQDSIYYAYQVAVEHYMGVIERDPHLIDVVGAIMFRLCISNSEFESILIGKMMTTSRLLTMDIDACTAFATDLSSQSSSDARIKISREKSIIRLFITLHTIGAKETNEPSRFNAIHLWRYVAVLLNMRPVVLSTVIILNQIIEVSNSIMQTLYPKQWPKILQFISSYLLPSVETSLHTSHLHQIAGEAVHISVLRNTLDLAM